MQRKLGGRGINEIMTAYECRIVSAKPNLTQNKENIKYLKSLKVEKMVLLELQIS